jgi:pSer/pThr/pTyr-binding forkhead associated (FHA) protein
MSNLSSPLVKILTPQRWAGFSMEFIEPGYIALFVKNGRCIREFQPGRHINFAMPWLTKCQLYLVNSKELTLEIKSQGDFSSKDGCLMNVSLNIRYKVAEPRRVALEIEDPITELKNAIKDALGVAIQNLTMQQLTRDNIRQYLLNKRDMISYPIGFSIEEIRVSDVEFPNSEGIIRQQQILNYAQQKDEEARRQMQIAQAGKPEYQTPNTPLIQMPIQIVNPINPAIPGSNQPQIKAITPQNIPPSLPPQGNVALPPTQITDQGNIYQQLVDLSTKQVFILSNKEFTIGREPSNNLVIPNSNSSASRYHAKIDSYLDSQGNICYQIIDNNSTNGTFVNGQKLIPHQPRLLTSGTMIVIGNQQWEFV